MNNDNNKYIKDVSSIKYMILPPPNATGELHCGHFLMTSILDTISRINNFILGNINYICPGIDHGGIAAQVAAFKHYKRQPTEMEIGLLSNKYKKDIEESLKKWHLNFDWSKNHYTLDITHSNFVSKVFCKLYDKGYIYRKKALINWDTGFKTAISDLEVDMVQKTDNLYFIDYKTSLGDIITVSTTRPETIFADVALMINPNDIEKNKYMGKFAYIPIINKKIPILMDEYVKIDFGTGVLKVTPGHDINDYNLAQKYQLPVLNIFNDNNEIIFKELNLDNYTLNDIYLKCDHNFKIDHVRKIIIQDLGCKYIEITHNVPVSSRSGARVENCMQEQWFMNMEEAAKLAIDCNIEYLPTDSFKNNMHSWLNNIQDWCISRSLPWGHTLPVWHGPNNEIVVSENRPGDKYIQSSFKLDTWFSSALWPLSYENRFQIFPFNTLVTGYDILFFWVARMIMVTLLWKKIINGDNFNMEESIPFDKVYLHGLVRDENGQKMSKTLNNVKNPNTEIELLNQKYPESNGYDILRLSLLLQVSPNNNVKMLSDPIRARNILTKLNNLHIFVNNNINSLNIIDKNSLNIIDKNSLNIIDKKSLNIIDKSNLNLYFEGRLQHFYDQIMIFAKDTSLHLMIEHIVNFLYEICDYLVEFYKVDESLYNILRKSFYMIIDLFSVICPKTSSDLYRSMSTSSPKVLKNYNFIPIETEHFIITIIKQLRMFKNLDIHYYYDGEYQNIINKMCNNNCNYQESLQKIKIAGQIVYLEINNKDKLVKYIKQKELELSKIFINNRMPIHIKINKEKNIKEINEELQFLMEIK